MRKLFLFLCFSAAKSSKKPLDALLRLSEKLFSFRWRKAAKATRPIPMPASGRLKAASGDCAGLQANRPRRSRFQSSVRFSAIGTKSGIALRGKKKHTLPKRIYFYHILCRQRRHNKSALSFDAEKERAGCGASATGWRIGLILRAPCSAADRTLPRKTTCGGFWYFWPQKYTRKLFLFLCFSVAKSSKKPLEVLLQLPEKLFFLCFSVAKSSKSHPTDSDVGVRTSESGVGRLRGFASKPSPPLSLSALRPLFRHRNQVGNRLAGKNKAHVAGTYLFLYRQRRHHKSALSFDAEKEGAGCGVSATGWRIGLILRAPCSAADRTLPRRTTCGGFWYF